MCSETSSPRLSFSSDLGQNRSQSEEEDHSHRRDTSLMDMGCDLEFSFFTSGFTDKQQSSTADELFSHGIILPTRPIQTPIYNNIVIAPSTSHSNPKNSLPPLNGNIHPKRENPKEIAGTCDNNNKNNKPQSKSFWGSFKRSSSLNCESKRSSTLLCSFPLLSRSNSTGSVPNQKKSNGVKEAMKSHSYSSSSSSPQKPPLISLARSSSSSLSNNNNNNNNYSYAMPQKPPLKKSYGGSYGNGIRVIPVINLPPPYISKGTAKLFGLGSFLHHGKDKNTKK